MPPVTVTTVPEEVFEHPLLPVTLTVYVPEDEVSTTLPPEAKVVGPLAVMVAVGNAFTVTVVLVELAEHPLALVTLTE